MGTLKKKKKVILKNEKVILFFSLLLTEGHALLNFHMFNSPPFALCILILSSKHKVYFHLLALIYGLNSK